MFKTVIIHPGTRRFEGNSPGTLYVAVSRGTTLGDADGLGSAIYFLDKSTSYDRFKYVKFKTNKDEMYDRVVLRERWVEKLKLNTKHSTMTEGQIKDILQWSETTRIDGERLASNITRFVDANSYTFT